MNIFSIIFFLFGSVTRGVIYQEICKSPQSICKSLENNHEMIDQRNEGWKFQWQPPNSACCTRSRQCARPAWPSTRTASNAITSTAQERASFAGFLVRCLQLTHRRRWVASLKRGWSLWWLRLGKKIMDFRVSQFLSLKSPQFYSFIFWADKFHFYVFISKNSFGLNESQFQVQLKLGIFD